MIVDPTVSRGQLLGFTKGIPTSKPLFVSKQACMAAFGKDADNHDSVSLWLQVGFCSKGTYRKIINFLQCAFGASLFTQFIGMCVFSSMGFFGPINLLVMSALLMILVLTKVVKNAIFLYKLSRTKKAMEVAGITLKSSKKSSSVKEGQLASIDRANKRVFTIVQSQKIFQIASIAGSVLAIVALVSGMISIGLFFAPVMAGSFVGTTFIYSFIAFSLKSCVGITALTMSAISCIWNVGIALASCARSLSKNDTASQLDKEIYRLAQDYGYDHSLEKEKTSFEQLGKIIFDYDPLAS